MVIENMVKPSLKILNRFFLGHPVEMGFKGLHILFTVWWQTSLQMLQKPQNGIWVISIRWKLTVSSNVIALPRMGEVEWPRIKAINGAIIISPCLP